MKCPRHFSEFSPKTHCQGHQNPSKSVPIFLRGTEANLMMVPIYWVPIPRCSTVLPVTLSQSSRGALARKGTCIAVIASSASGDEDLLSDEDLLLTWYVCSRLCALTSYLEGRLGCAGRLGCYEFPGETWSGDGSVSKDGMGRQCAPTTSKETAYGQSRGSS